MKAKGKRKAFLAGLLSMMLALFWGAGIPAVPVWAESGTVYTCVIHPCYAHPVTGEIEDSGGEASYATGQGMVEGAVYTTGILELTDSGGYYLTIRMSLMDYTSGHSFWVQNVGDSGWATPAVGVTGNGSDSNGTTADICIQVPSENCVVRGSMYVDPMGRDVVFYLYPSDFSQGNNTDMNATMVTAAAGSDAAAASGSTAAAESSSAGTSAQSSEAAQLQSQTAETTPAPTAEALESEAATPTLTAAPESEEQEEPAMELESSIEAAATPQPEVSTDETLSDAQGLSLSTQGEAAAGELGESIGQALVSYLFIAGAVFVLGGLILLGAAAGIVYFFRKNWRRWGGGEDDDE